MKRDRKHTPVAFFQTWAAAASPYEPTVLMAVSAYGAARTRKLLRATPPSASSASSASAAAAWRGQHSLE